MSNPPRATLVMPRLQLAEHVELEPVGHREIDRLVEVVVSDVQEPAGALVRHGFGGRGHGG